MNFQGHFYSMASSEVRLNLVLGAFRLLNWEHSTSPLNYYLWPYSPSFLFFQKEPTPVLQDDIWCWWISSVKAVGTRLQPTIDVNSAWSVASSSTLSFWKGTSVVIIATFDSIPNTRQEGTSPYYPIITVLAFTATSNILRKYGWMLVHGFPIILAYKVFANVLQFEVNCNLLLHIEGAVLYSCQFIFPMSLRGNGSLVFRSLLDILPILYTIFE